MAAKKLALPDITSNTTEFLRHDGTWAVPPGSGDLILTDGITTVDPTTQIFVAATGDATVEVTDLGGGAAGIQIGATGGGSSIGWLWYGTGEDGSAVLDGANTFSFASKSGNNYTLTRSVQLTDLTIDSGCTLDPDSFPVYCSGTLTNNGTIKTNGANGTTNSTTSGRSSNCYGGSTGCASGQAGTNSDPSWGGAGGIGGDDNLGNHGKAGGTVALPANINGGNATLGSIFSLTTGRSFAGGSPGSFVVLGGAGGGTGHATAGNPYGGGGGGAGGGVVPLYANTMAGNGAIQAVGGNGSNGGVPDCGGGGGGGGGVIIALTNTASWRALYTLSVAGGSGGAPNGGGGAGASGSTGRILG